MLTILDLFSGIGGFKTGVSRKDNRVISVDRDPFNPAHNEAVVTGHLLNHNPKDIFLNKSVLDLNPVDFTKYDIDWLHISPPCQSFSLASTHSERENDILLATKCAEFVSVLKPKIVTIENVPAFAHSRSYGVIKEALSYLQVKSSVLDFYYYGVPQNRVRFIAIASETGLHPMAIPCQPTVSWFESIEDLVPSLFELPLTSHQQYYIDNQHSIATNETFIIARFNRKTKKAVIRGKNEPCKTILSSMFGVCNPNSGILNTGRSQVFNVVINDVSFNASMRCIARWGGFPDTFKLSGYPIIDGRGIGNSIPPKFSALLYDYIFKH